ncbi:MAG: 4Fe-4S dicluster domain-containing protein [Holophagaceae bacterium]|nr:4Fe-4S dicluster domain-containing protein [Holophagaceae bacterium]
MLKKIRITIATIVIVLITWLFLDFSGVLHLWFGWLAKIQLIPAVFVSNAIIVLALVLLTQLFGRIYCSILCPFGILQDCISHISGRRSGKGSRFRFSMGMPLLRNGIFILFIIGLLAGISVVVSLLDPYAAFGRVASNIFSPVYRFGNNILASLAESVDSYALYPTSVWTKSWITLGVALATISAIGLLAWKNGRTYCNTICPVGTFLGIFSRNAVYKLTIDTKKCTKCGLCEKGCKASCIDSANSYIDHSRCVACFNCIGNCKLGGLKYVPKMEFLPESKQYKPTTPDTESNTASMTRRSALAIAWGVAFARVAKAQESLVNIDGGLAELQDKKIPERKTQVVPPGAESLSNLSKKCSACQLCVSSCPNNVLRPSNGLSSLMQPEMSFEAGYCRPECVECSLVCPSGAIQKITKEEKTTISIGSVVWVKENCVVNRDKVQCNSCQRRCPTEAITLVIDPEADGKLKIPVIDNEKCIGCGACEYYCPARPFSAIFVEGHHRHHSI